MFNASSFPSSARRHRWEYVWLATLAAGVGAPIVFFYGADAAEFALPAGVAPVARSTAQAFPGRAAPPGSGVTNAIELDEATSPPVSVQYLVPADTSKPPNAQLIKLLAKKMRLDAERSASNHLVFPAGFESGNVAAKFAATSERRMFEVKRASTQNQKDQLRERIGQHQHEIAGIAAQRAAKLKEIELIRKELKLVENLHRKQLTNDVRLIESQRELARFEGEAANMSTQIDRVELQVRELKLQVEAIDRSVAVEAEKELQEVESEISQLMDRASAPDQPAQGARSDGGPDNRWMREVAAMYAAGARPRAAMPSANFQSVAASPSAGSACRDPCNERSEKTGRRERERVAARHGSEESAQESRTSRRRPYYRSQTAANGSGRTFTRTMRKIFTLNF